jgi:hypothetical protein
MYAWQWKGEWGSDEIAMFLTLPWKNPTKSEISWPDIIHKTKALQMYTFLNHGRWNRCSWIYKNDAALFFNVWHQLRKFSEIGWPRSACNFIFPLRNRWNAIHRNSSRLSPSELVFSLGKGARTSGWCALHTRKWRHPCTLILILEFSFKFISIEKNWNGYRFANFWLK